VYVVEQDDEITIIVPETIEHDEVVETKFNRKKETKQSKARVRQSRNLGKKC
jgi:Zn ribbon nucleic-acid-binding protein